MEGVCSQVQVNLYHLILHAGTYAKTHRTCTQHIYKSHPPLFAQTNALSRTELMMPGVRTEITARATWMAFPAFDAFRPACVGSFLISCIA